MAESSRALTGERAATDPAGIVLRALAGTLGDGDFVQRASAALTELANALGCSRVVLGLMRDGAVHIEAVSHAAAPHKGSVLFRDICDAMEEAIDQGRAIRVPIAPGTAMTRTPVLIRAHLQLRARHGGTVHTVPLAGGSGAISFEWESLPARAPLAEAEIDQMVALLGPVLLMAYRESRPCATRMRESVAQTFSESFGGRQRWRIFAAAALVVLLATIAALPVTHSVSARSRLEGSVERAVVAPVDGFIDKVHVRPGDQVRSGQVVIELATRDLELEAQRWQTEKSQHESAYMAALARSDRAEMMVSLSRAEEARARLDLVRQRLGRMQVVAGIDGIVIDGDAGRLLGAPVARGDVLLTIAPESAYRVVLDVDERDIARLASGQSGKLLLGALPLQPLAITVERITPMAQVVDGNNVYRVEARLSAPVDGLRPGLQGMAKLDAGRSAMAVAAWRWISERVRTAWWRWGG